MNHQTLELEGRNMSGAFLTGFRALDLTELSGQLCGRMLGDLGMEVIKIEPPGGDPVRNLAAVRTIRRRQATEHDVCPFERGQSEQGARLGQGI